MAHSVASALENIQLVDADEKPVRLGDAWKDRPAVLVFIRHFG